MPAFFSSDRPRMKLIFILHSPVRRHRLGDLPFYLNLIERLSQLSKMGTGFSQFVPAGKKIGAVGSLFFLSYIAMAILRGLSQLSFPSPFEIRPMPFREAMLLKVQCT